MNPFHLAIPVRDIDEARTFYVELLACREGRSDATWVDFNFYGHQLVCHFSPDTGCKNPVIESPVDGHDVPVPHFGIVLNMKDWEAFAERLKRSGIAFAIEPYIRFKGQAGEQGTMFFYDPSGNAIEIKGFMDVEAQLFS